MIWPPSLLISTPKPSQTQRTNDPGRNPGVQFMDMPSAPERVLSVVSIDIEFRRIL